MDRSGVEQFEKSVAQLKGMHEELSALSKKKADAPLSSFKLKLVNSLMERVEAGLGEKYCPFEQFSAFDGDDMPTVSDVTLMLNQYLECAETMRADNIKQHHGLWFWDVGESFDKPNQIRTAPPAKVMNK